MTKAELVEAGTDRYMQLKQKIQGTSDPKEKRQLHLEIVTLIEGMLYIVTKMKHLG